ncbi:MAG: hypothetical protein R3Y40_07150 [Eubacteriales bacterium]
MVKTTKVTGMLVCGVILLLICSTFALASTREELTITEEVLVGDVSVVEGMTLHMKSEMAGQHFWNMEVPMGNAEATEVSYEYFDSVQGDAYIETPELYLRTIQNGRLWFYECEDLEALRESYDLRANDAAPIEAILDVASRMEYQEDGTGTYTETVKYSDYYEYYPVEVSLSFYDEDGLSYKALSSDAREQIQAACKIPVVEGHEIIISVSFDKEQVWEIGIDSVVQNDETGIYSYGAINEEEAYLINQVKTRNGELDETKEYEAAQIYYISFNTTEESGYLEVEEIKELNLISEGAEVIDLKECGDTILAYLVEENESYIAVYSKESLEEIQRITLNHEFSWMKAMDQNMYVQSMDSDFTVLKWDGDQYEVFLEGNLEATNLDEQGYYYYSATYTLLDDKLVMSQQYRAHYGYLGDTIVSCYDDTGLIYMGRYYNSQQGEQEIGDYELNIQESGVPSVTF